MEPTPVGAEPTLTETFTGTVLPGGFMMHTFELAVAPGKVVVTLTAIGPPGDLTEGLGVGTPVADFCNLDLGTGSYMNVTASAAPQLTGTIRNAGQHCVVVYDVGRQTETVTYSVTVSHS